jgi:hypothetical protein
MFLFFYVFILLPQPGRLASDRTLLEGGREVDCLAGTKGLRVDVSRGRNFWVMLSQG